MLERLTMIELRVSKKQNDMSSASSALFTKARGHQPDKGKTKMDFSKVKCHSCQQFGHIKFKCPTKSSKPVSTDSASGTKTSALYGQVLLSEVTIDDIWIPDSGASHHMTKMKHCYSTYTAFDEPKPVTLGNKKQMLAYGQGDIYIEAVVDGKCKLHCLKDVWYTPDVVMNLLSVSSATDKGAEYYSDKGCCRLMRDGEVLIVGERYDKLYKLIVRTVKPESPVVVCIANKVETLQVWRGRFGHQSKQYVEKYLKKHSIEFVKDNLFCEGCVLGKQHRFSLAEE